MNSYKVKLQLTPSSELTTVTIQAKDETEARKKAKEKYENKGSVFNIINIEKI
jgi:hypothetical protein